VSALRDREPLPRRKMPLETAGEPLGICLRRPGEEEAFRFQERSLAEDFIDLADCASGGDVGKVLPEVGDARFMGENIDEADLLGSFLQKLEPLSARLDRCDAHIRPRNRERNAREPGS